MSRTIRLSSTNSRTTVILAGGSGVRFFDPLFILRPTLIFPLITMLLAGYRLAQVDNGLVWYKWIMFMSGAVAWSGFMYLLNQIRDRESDIANNKLFLVEANALSRTQLITEAVILAIMAPLMAFMAGYGHLVLLALIMFVIGGVLYSFTPLAMQNHPVTGLLTGIAGGLMLLLFGGLVAGKPGLWISLTPYILAFSGACLLTTLPDKSGDESNGKRTFAVAYGCKKTMFISLIGITAAGIWGVILRDWVIVVPAVISTPVLLRGWLTNSIDLAVIANKLAIFSLSIAIGVIYTPYLIVIAVYYPFARWYYSRRMGMHYPSFGGE